MREVDTDIIKRARGCSGQRYNQTPLYSSAEIHTSSSEPGVPWARIRSNLSVPFSPAPLLQSSPGWPHQLRRVCMQAETAVEAVLKDAGWWWREIDRQTDGRTDSNRDRDLESRRKDRDETDRWQSSQAERDRGEESERERERERGGWGS